MEASSGTGVWNSSPRIVLEHVHDRLAAMAGLAVAGARDHCSGLLPQHRYRTTLSEYAEEENKPRNRPHR